MRKYRLKNITSKVFLTLISSVFFAFQSYSQELQSKKSTDPSTSRAQVSGCESSAKKTPIENLFLNQSLFSFDPSRSGENYKISFVPHFGVKSVSETPKKSKVDKERLRELTLRCIEESEKKETRLYPFEFYYQTDDLSQLNDLDQNLQSIRKFEAGVNGFIGSDYEAESFRFAFEQRNLGEKLRERRFRCEVVVDHDEQPQDQSQFWIGRKTHFGTHFVSESALTEGQSHVDPFYIEMFCNHGVRTNLGSFVSCEADVGATFRTNRIIEGGVDSRAQVSLHTRARHWLERRRPAAGLTAEIECRQLLDFQSRETNAFFGIETNFNRYDGNRARCRLGWVQPIEQSDQIYSGIERDEGQFEFLFSLSF